MYLIFICSVVTQAASQEEMEARTEVGLVKGHAYGITSVKKVYIGETSLINLFSQKEKIYMVRMRNPWGQKEWNGPFSDGQVYCLKINYFVKITDGCVMCVSALIVIKI